MGENSGKKVAIPATDGFEQSELEVPKKKLTEAGATVDVVTALLSKLKASIQGGGRRGRAFGITKALITMRVIRSRKQFSLNRF